MSDLIALDEHVEIYTEFETLSDYRSFILKHFDTDNLEIQYLVIKANWLLILEEKEELFFLTGLHQFIRKYQDHIDDRVKLLVVDAWLRKIKSELPELQLNEANEEINSFAEYVHVLHGSDIELYKAWVYIYWFKGQYILEKDWRKAQYFYNKVIAFSREIADEEHQLYIAKAKIAKVSLHILHEHFEHVDGLFYKCLDKYLPYQDQEVLLQLMQLVQLYIKYLFTNKLAFGQTDNSKKFLHYIEIHPPLKQMILEMEVLHSRSDVLLSLGQQLWLRQQLIYEEFFLKYFEQNTLENSEDILKEIDEQLSLEPIVVKQQLFEVVQRLYDRHINLAKYRKLFNRKTKKLI